MCRDGDIYTNKHNNTNKRHDKDVFVLLDTISLEDVVANVVEDVVAKVVEDVVDSRVVDCIVIATFAPMLVTSMEAVGNTCSTPFTLILTGPSIAQLAVNFSSERTLKSQYVSFHI